ncbi:MAG: FAD:protein FMN transferase [Nannocystaceae bacterium]
MGARYLVRFGGTLEAPHGDRGGTVLAERVQTVLDGVDARMSNYRPDSELSRLNAAAAGEDIEVSAPLYEVLALSQRVARESGGALDITVAPLVDAYGFGPGERTSDPVELARRRELVGYAQLRLLAPGIVRKEQAGVACTLSAVAKGYAVDQVARVLEEAGVHDYMVEVGGEVKVRGRNASGRPWRVGIERPAADAFSAPRVQEALEPGDAAVATSGDYRNYREENGVRVSHTLDPRTGAPIRHTLASVTVVHPSAAAADAYATALNVLGPREGPALAERLGLAALFLVREGATFRSVATQGFSELRTSQRQTAGGSA